MTSKVLSLGLTLLLSGAVARADVQARADAFLQTPVASSLAEETRPTLLPEGSVAPDFDLPTPDGKRITLEEALQGKKVLLLNFWFYS